MLFQAQTHVILNLRKSHKLLKPALILSRESFFFTINPGNRCKTKRLYSLGKMDCESKKQEHQMSLLPDL